MTSIQNSSAISPAARPPRYLRQAEVLARVGVSWITLLRWERRKAFPQRRRLGPNTVAWLESEVDAWCASRSAANEDAGT